MQIYDEIQSDLFAVVKTVVELVVAEQPLI